MDNSSTKLFRQTPRGNLVAQIRYSMSAIALGYVSIGTACGQSTDYRPPEKSIVDENGVDLTNHTLNISFPLVSLGDGIRLQPKFSLSQPINQYQMPFGWGNDSFVKVASNTMATGIYELTMGSAFAGFPPGLSPAGGEYAIGIPRYKDEGWGFANSNGTTYAQGVGPRQIVPFYGPPVAGGGRIPFGTFDEEGNGTGGGPHSVNFHDGEFWDYYRFRPANCAYSRVRAIVSNMGFAVQFTYADEGCPTSGGNSPHWAPKSIVAINLSRTYCDFSLGAICVSEAAAANKTIFNYDSNTGSVNVTLSDGRVKTFKFNSNNGMWSRYVNIISVPNSDYEISYTYGNMGSCEDQAVKTASVAGQTWTYRSGGMDNSDRVCVAGVIDRLAPDGKTVSASRPESPGIGAEFGAIVDSRGAVGYVDELGRGWDQFAGFGITGFPQGNQVIPTIDNRRNIKSITLYAAGNYTSGIQTYSASFSTDCNNPKTCNKPMWTRDAFGNQTDYTYDETHGGILTVMKPAPVAGGSRPLEIYTYIQKSANVLNSGGALTSTGSPIWMRSTETVCQTGAGSSAAVCDASAPQVVTNYQYGPEGSADNLLLRGRAVSSGGQTLRTCFGYDEWGRKISETAPNANLTSCP